MKKRALVWIIGIVYFICFSEAQAKDESFCLENAYVSFCFNPSTFGLTSMIDKVTRAEHIYNDSTDAILWQLDFKMGTNSTSFSNKIVKPVAEHRILADGSQLLSLTWDKILWWRENEFCHCSRNHKAARRFRNCNVAY